MLYTFDTSLTCTGGVVFQNEKPLKIYHVKGAKWANLDTHERLHINANAIVDQITEFDNEYTPDARFIFELPVVSSNAGGTMKLCMLLGTIIECLYNHYSSPRIGFVNNKQWKRVACGHGGIVDTAYLEYAKRVYPDSEFKKVDEAAAYLIGIAVMNDVPIDYKLGIKS